MFSLDGCVNRCSSEAFCYNPGLVGKNYDEHRIMFVLHRSDGRANPENGSKPKLQQSLDFGFGEIDSPSMYSKALKESDTGRVLNWLLRDGGLTFDDVYITNLFKCLLPKDRNPTDAEYVSCADVLKNQVASAAPRKIVAFGGQTLKYMFPGTDKLGLMDWVSTRTLYEDVPSLIMYHPRRIHDMKKAEQRKYLNDIRSFLKDDISPESIISRFNIYY